MRARKIKFAWAEYVTLFQKCAEIVRSEEAKAAAAGVKAVIDNTKDTAQRIGDLLQDIKDSIDQVKARSAVDDPLRAAIHATAREVLAQEGFADLL